MAALEEEHEFKSEIARVNYAHDKVNQYYRMVNWEHDEPPQFMPHPVIKRIAEGAAYHLSRELNSIGVLYRAPDLGKQPDGT